MSGVADLPSSLAVGFAASAPNRWKTIRLPASLAAACLGAALLAGCSGGSYCVNQFHGGCAVGPTPVAAAAAPAPIPAPAPMPVPAPVAAAPTPAVRLGDPSQFAKVDDAQCRSYGLKFGTHDYADCRIRLSAQHRGLDPDIGTTPGSR